MKRTRIAGFPVPRLHSRFLILLLGLIIAAVARIRTRSVRVFAHRGFANEAPENTVEAVSRGATLADGIEIDVRRCGSGELVCLHDETLERLTGSQRRVDETDWETLRTVSVDGQPIARLEDVLEAIPEDVLVNVELKERGLTHDVLAAVDVHEGDVLLSSFDQEALADVRAHDETIPLAYVFRSPGGALSCDVLETAADLDCVAVHPRADYCFSSAIVLRAHRQGFAVNAWTIDSRLEMRLLTLAGVDGVFSDSSDVR